MECTFSNASDPNIEFVGFSISLELSPSND
jgi:hypothetical protein